LPQFVLAFTLGAFVPLLDGFVLDVAEQALGDVVVWAGFVEGHLFHGGYGHGLIGLSFVTAGFGVCVPVVVFPVVGVVGFLDSHRAMPLAMNKMIYLILIIIRIESIQ
jgi:hypothetical protein